ncbi:MAG TPA: hypothetical protein VJ895_01915 [Candidatus Nanoarchaeia archaeon]|nr:hypothetical protein [Candidatus Nanoarchaeia archaeon]
MHKISKILQQKNLSLNNLNEIKKMWESLTFSTQNVKAPCFYKQVKKHLVPERKFQIENISCKDREKFQNALRVLRGELIFVKKEETVRLIKMNALQNNSKIEKAIQNLLIELKGERDFIKEMQISLNNFGMGNKIKSC